MFPKLTCSSKVSELHLPVDAQVSVISVKNLHQICYEITKKLRDKLKEFVLKLLLLGFASRCDQQQLGRRSDAGEEAPPPSSLPDALLLPEPPEEQIPLRLRHHDRLAPPLAPPAPLPDYCIQLLVFRIKFSFKQNVKFSRDFLFWVLFLVFWLFLMETFFYY